MTLVLVAVAVLYVVVRARPRAPTEEVAGREKNDQDERARLR